MVLENTMGTCSFKVTNEPNVFLHKPYIRFIVIHNSK